MMKVGWRVTCGFGIPSLAVRGPMGAQKPTDSGKMPSGSAKKPRGSVCEKAKGVCQKAKGVCQKAKGVRQKAKGVCQVGDQLFVGVVRIVQRLF